MTHIMQTPESSPAKDGSTSARQYGRDMAALRQSHGTSLEEMHRKTRISLSILEEFESTGLVTNALFNRVYLRSFIITYSRLAGIDEQRALDALELALTGSYAGEMSASEGRAVDLGSDESRVEDPETDPAEEPQTDAMPPSGIASPGGMSARTHSTPRVRKRDLPRRFQFEPLGTKARLRKEISTAVHDFREPTQQRGLILPHGRLRAALFVAAIVTVSVSAAVLAFRLSSTDSPSPIEQSASGAIEDQPVRMEPRPPEREPVTLPPVTLADSIAVTVIAVDGPLDPIRIRVDRDLRRPYWIVAGDSMTFYFRQRMTLEELLDLAVVRVEGTTYPRQNYRADSLLVLDRDKAAAIVQSGRRK